MINLTFKKKIQLTTDKRVFHQPLEFKNIISTGGMETPDQDIILNWIPAGTL